MSSAARFLRFRFFKGDVFKEVCAEEGFSVVGSDEGGSEVVGGAGSCGWD